MNRFSQFYRKNTNGIIITLLVHILVFTVLYLTKIDVKNVIKETEILIDFAQEIPFKENLPDNQEKELKEEINKEEQSTTNEQTTASSGRQKTNVASNRSSSNQNKNFDEQLERELRDAQNLIKDVNQQLKREIPTIDNLKMPDAPQADQNDFKNKIYTGESNIEYFLENRYHIKLPIPVYLAQGGGKVKVEIVVDRMGNVIKAEPIITPSLSEQILSYAKTAALKTKFNSDNNAPAEQKGYITYTFIPQ